MTRIRVLITMLAVLALALMAAPVWARGEGGGFSGGSHGGGGWGGSAGSYHGGGGGSWGGGEMSRAPVTQSAPRTEGTWRGSGQSFGQPSTGQSQQLQIHPQWQQFQLPSSQLQDQGWSEGAARGWSSQTPTTSLGSQRFGSPFTGEAGRATVNGSSIHFPVSPRMEDGHVVAPVKSFVQGMGGTMTRDSRTGEWAVRRDGHELRFHEGDRHGRFDGREIDLFVAPFFYDGFLFGSLDPFYDYFGVPYGYYSYGYPVAPAPAVASAAATISEGLAISLASRYLQGVGQYPDNLVDVTAHQNTAPANAYWDALASGREPIANAPLRPCWIVEYQYSLGGRQEWRQVFVDVENGQVIGGSQS